MQCLTRMIPTSWPKLDENGRVEICTLPRTPIGAVEFTGDSQYGNNSVGSDFNVGRRYASIRGLFGWILDFERRTPIQFAKQTWPAISDRYD